MAQTTHWKSRERPLLSEAIPELQRHPRQSHEHPQEYQQYVPRHLSEVQQEVQVQQVASWEEVEHMRHELTQSLAEGSHYFNLFTRSISDASDRSSETQQLRHGRKHWPAHSRNSETEKLACQSAVRSLATQVTQVLQMTAMI